MLHEFLKSRPPLAIGHYGVDQLRQRMAWVLAQIITTVQPGELPISHFPNSHFVTQHNLICRETSTVS